MNRLLDISPVLHVFEHSLHPVHCDTAQSRAHLLPQLRSSLSMQRLPPLVGAAIICRILAWVPLPHETEQSLHLPHLPTLQSLGQACDWQERDSTTAGGYLQVFGTLRDLNMTPAPHVFEQVLHSFQALTVHGRVIPLQGVVPHCRVWPSVPHAFPNALGMVKIARFLACLPPPHLRLHVAHLDQVDVTQFTGHTCWLHDLVRAAAPQKSPPNIGGTTTLRRLTCSPPPHGLEHFFHPAHSPS